jgi:hypothetical protein
MRHLVTFILHLWVDHENNSPSYEGQVECVATREQKHVRSSEEILSFIETRLKPSSTVETAQEGGGGQMIENNK